MAVIILNVNGVITVIISLFIWDGLNKQDLD